MNSPWIQRGANYLGRRQFLQQLTALGVLGGTSSGWLPALAQDLAAHPQRKRQCILLWMAGGPSQMDTFDPKPGTANGGEFKAKDTSVPGMQFCEHLPKLATLAEHMAVVRSLNTKEGDHGRGAYLVRTGRRPGGPVRFPCISAALAKELSDPQSELPQYVSVGSPDFLNPAAFSPGFLGPQYAAATVGVIRDDNNPNPQPQNQPPNQDPAAQPMPSFAQLGLDYLRAPKERLRKRQELWTSLQQGFISTHPANNAVTQDTVYRRAMQLMQSQAAGAFDLTQESDDVRERYGRGVFGQGCLLARRLVEQGVPFVEITLGGVDDGGLGWDTHQNNFPGVKALCQQLDGGWSALMEDLRDRGLLESTTILWIGEFGRTPTINDMAGRDHFPNAWSCVFAGGGIKGGQVYGKTSDDGQEVVDGQVGIEQVLATLCAALGVPPSKENETAIGRPIKIIEGEPISQLVV